MSNEEHADRRDGSYAYSIFQDIHSIPAKKYSGYIWWDGDRSGTVIDGELNIPEVEDRMNDQQHIVEGHVFAQDGSVSVSFRSHEAGLQIGMADWNQAEVLLDSQVIELQNQSYLAYQLSGIAKLCFIYAWIPTEDEYCENMEVLYPGWVALRSWEKS